MAVVGTVQLLGLGLESRPPLPSTVDDVLHHLWGRSDVSVLDILLVTRDDRGAFTIEAWAPAGESADPPGSTLRQLLEGGTDELQAVTVPLDLHSSSEVGLDLSRVEGIAYRIPLGTSALFVLAEARWVTGLLDAVVAAAGFPLVFGCLEPETMLVVGPSLAAAAEAREARDAGLESTAGARLDSLQPGDPSDATVAVLRALVEARVVDPAHLEDAITTLQAARLLPGGDA